MNTEQIDRIVSEVRQNLGLPYNKTPDVQRYVNRAARHALIFCNREDIPPLLEGVIAEMAEDMLKADNVAETPQQVSSVSRGDVTISYRDASSAYKQSTSFLKDYQSQLVHFRKMKLPG
jgi:hypothetical protein